MVKSTERSPEVQQNNAILPESAALRIKRNVARMFGKRTGWSEKCWLPDA